jgi:hypothetical protein
MGCMAREGERRGAGNKETRNRGNERMVKWEGMVYPIT